MTVIGLDDTDSREQGMCTTYAASRIADEISAAAGAVTRVLLIRLNPAVEHKTRGNAALAIHTDLGADRAFEVAREFVADSAVTDDPRTSPGVVVADGTPDAVPDDIAAFARDAMSRHHDLADAEALIDAHGYRSAGWDGGRGRIGALAAIGAWRAHDDWTYEYISYRELPRRGTPRDIDLETVFAAADDYYPGAWDTVDRVEGQAVCVPHTPGPILHGIRGDDADAVRGLAEYIQGEPVESARLFHTNQGTDVHLIDGKLGDLTDGYAYRVDGTVVDPPETREGGHVFLTVGDGDASRQCAAFEPTKRFRDRVRALRAGDQVTVCGEVSGGTLKLEKFAVRSLENTELVTPTCPDCERRMESAGAGQGYRCRDCKTSSDGKVERRIERDVEPGWYEVPPCARRHIAKPLVRGGFDAPIHPER